MSPRPSLDHGRKRINLTVSLAARHDAWLNKQVAEQGQSKGAVIRKFIDNAIASGKKDPFR